MRLLVRVAIAVMCTAILISVRMTSAFLPTTATTIARRTMISSSSSGCRRFVRCDTTQSYQVRFHHHNPMHGRIMVHAKTFTSSSSSSSCRTNAFRSQNSWRTYRPNHGPKPQFFLSRAHTTTSEMKNVNNDDNTSSAISNTIHHENILFFPTSTPTTVVETVQTTVRTLEGNERYATLEPTMSTVHLFAMVLQLPWEAGYYDLLQIVNLNESKSEWKKNEPSANSLSLLANRVVSVEELQLFHSYLIRRMIHQEPIQYICGQWDFLSSTFEIRAPLLCPRPETEELTMYAIQDIHTARMIQQSPPNKENSKRPFRVLDIGCGTGCIGISIAKEISEVKVTAIDIEPIAVQISNRNAARILDGNFQNRYAAQLIDIEQFGTQMKHRTQSQFDGAIENENNLLFDMVVSNPPYILPSDMDTLEASVLQYESHTALDGGGPDGLNIIRVILQQLPYICHNHAICWMEIDPSQPQLIEEYTHTFNEHQIQQQQQQQQRLVSDYDQQDRNTVPSNLKNFEKAKGIRYVESVKDMFGYDRFVKLQVIEL